MVLLLICTTTEILKTSIIIIIIPREAMTRPHLNALSLALLNTRNGSVRARCTLLRRMGAIIVPIQLSTTAVEKLVGKSLIAAKPPETISSEMHRIRSFTRSVKCPRMLTIAPTVDRNIRKPGVTVTVSLNEMRGLGEQRFASMHVFDLVINPRNLCSTIAFVTV